MFNNLFKTLIPLALLPMFAFAQPAQARHLFWWQDDGPDMTQDAPPPYQQVYGAPEYQDLYGNRDDSFDERQYQLYQREMRRRYGYQAELPPDDGPYAQPPVYNTQPQYAAPPYVAPRYVAPTYAAPVLPKPKKIVKTARVAPKTPDATTATATTNTKVASAPVASAPPTKPTTTVDCDKGAAIVSGFGFDNVKTKACAADTLAYNAERSGQPFEVSVNPKTGELIAVKKLPAPSATPVKTTNSTRTDI
jgi:hypothetical protein